MIERDEPPGVESPIADVPPVSLPVPEGFLNLPSPGDRQRVLRVESGLALDPHLQRLSRLSGAIDRGLALRLLVLRRSSGYLRLGKACFGDYVRERVGVAARTAQEWVRLGRALERLPLLDDALREGRVTWTAAAQAGRVAGVEDEADWVGLAERIPVRDLKARVDKALRQRSAASRGLTAAPSNGRNAGGGATLEDAGDVADVTHSDSTGLFEQDPDDRPVKLRLFTSKRTSHLWEAALELCELVAGSPLTPAEAPEFALADFLSGTDPAGDDVRAFPAHPPRKHRNVSRRGESSRKVKHLAGPIEPLEDRQVRFSSADLSAEVREVLKLIDEDIPCDPVRLDSSIRALMAARRGLDLDLARLLRVFHWLGLARHLGFRSFSAYVEERLNISADRARFLVRLDRSLTDFGFTQEAVRQGRIGSVAAMLVARAASPGKSETAWLERARQVSVVRLRKEVQWAERRNCQRGFRTALPPSTGPLPSALQTLTAAVLSDENAVLHPFEGARAWIRTEEEDSSDPIRAAADRETFARSAKNDGSQDDDQDAADRETFARSAKNDVSQDDDQDAAVHPREDRSCRGDGLTGQIEGVAIVEAIRVYRELFLSDEGPEGETAVEFWLRKSALDLWTEARRRIAAAAKRKWISDAEVLHEVALAFLLTHIRGWLEAVQAGDPTAVRDRFVCQVPGCTMRAGAGHHLRFRSDLGPDEAWNLLFICWGHHLVGIHGGPWIRLTGRAPDALRAELGLLPGGKALESWVRGVPAAGTDRQCA